MFRLGRNVGMLVTSAKANRSLIRPFSWRPATAVEKNTQFFKAINAHDVMSGRYKYGPVERVEIQTASNVIDHEGSTLVATIELVPESSVFENPGKTVTHVDKAIITDVRPLSENAILRDPRQTNWILSLISSFICVLVYVATFAIVFIFIGIYMYEPYDVNDV